VERHPTEFDVLIVQTASSPVSGTAAFREEDVKVWIGIKKHGFYFKNSEAKKRISQYFGSRFREIGKPFVYLTVKEYKALKIATDAALGNNAFYLCESPNHESLGQWQGFVERVLDLCP